MIRTLLILYMGAFFVACNGDRKKEEKMDDKNETSVNNSPSREEKNKQVIMASMDAFSKNEFDKVFADTDPSFMDYTDGSTPPMSADSVKGFFRLLKDAIPDYKGSGFEYIAEGNKVVVLAEWSGTLKKDLMGIKPTGKPFTFRDADIFTFNDNNKVISHQSIANFAAVMMAAK